MAERELLSSAIKARTAWATVREHIETDVLTAQGQIIWAAVSEYYGRDSEAERCDPELLARAVERKVANPKHKESFAKLVVQLGSLDVSPANVIEDYVAVNREAVASKLAAALTNGKQEVINELLEEYSSWESATLEQEEEFDIQNGVSTEVLVSELMSGEGQIKLYPKSLNDRIGGGALRGHHIVLYARPEAGKTAFLVNATFGFLQQGLRVLYIGNEEPLRPTQRRLQSRLTGRTVNEMACDPKAINEEALSKGYANAYFLHLEPGTPAAVDRATARIKPDVLIVDQLRNLQSKDDGFTQQLEHVARDVRSIGARHNCLVISVTQAGGSADGKAILDMSDVDSSKTGIPAQADLLIGLGFDSADEAAGRRTISLVKNKLSGQHEFFHVGIEPEYSRFSSMG